MADNVPAATPAVAAAAPAPPLSPWLQALAALVEGVPIVGKFVKFLIDKRLWGPLVATVSAVFLLVVYPLLVPYLAAYWSSKGLLLGAQDAYVNEVRSGFRVREAADEVTTESYKRLDYFIPIEFSRPIIDGKSYTLPVMPMQKLQIQVSPAKLTSLDGVCTAPELATREDADLLDVQLNDTLVGKVRNSGHVDTLELTKAVWDDIMKRRTDLRAMDLRFKPAAMFATLQCRQLVVDVNASVLVFKDVYKP